MGIIEWTDFWSPNLFFALSLSLSFSLFLFFSFCNDKTHTPVIFATVDGGFLLRNKTRTTISTWNCSTTLHTTRISKSKSFFARFCTIKFLYVFLYVCFLPFTGSVLHRIRTIGVHLSCSTAVLRLVSLYPHCIPVVCKIIQLNSCNWCVHDFAFWQLFSFFSFCIPFKPRTRVALMALFSRPFVLFCFTVFFCTVCTFSIMVFCCCSYTWT